MLVMPARSRSLSSVCWRRALVVCSALSPWSIAACTLPEVKTQQPAESQAGSDDEDAGARGGTGAEPSPAGHGGARANAGAGARKEQAGSGGTAHAGRTALSTGGASAGRGGAGGERAGAGGASGGAGGAAAATAGAGGTGGAAGGMNNGPCSASVCTADYPCEIRGVTYGCRGQFVDWAPPTTPDMLTADASRGTVADARSGLVWQRMADNRSRGWDDAKSYCAGLSLAGGGWRLPTKAELESIVDDSKYGPAIDSNAFPSTATTYFWTSSPLSGSPGFAWYISFQGGDSRASDTIFPTLARCVRSTVAVFPASGSGGAPPTRYDLSVPGTITDTLTQLVWQRDLDAKAYAQPDALSYCNGLTLSDRSWRLPTRAELLTIVDPTHYAPSIDPTVFGDTPSAFFWSSSASGGVADSVWSVSFTSGGSTTELSTKTNRVRCVSSAKK